VRNPLNRHFVAAAAATVGPSLADEDADVACNYWFVSARINNGTNSIATICIGDRRLTVRPSIRWSSHPRMLPAGCWTHADEMF
jgi:hypothetical protein